MEDQLLDMLKTRNETLSAIICTKKRRFEEISHDLQRAKYKVQKLEMDSINEKEKFQKSAKAELAEEAINESIQILMETENYVIITEPGVREENAAFINFLKGEQELADFIPPVGLVDHIKNTYEFKTGKLQLTMNCERTSQCSDLHAEIYTIGEQHVIMDDEPGTVIPYNRIITHDVYSADADNEELVATLLRHPKFGKDIITDGYTSSILLSCIVINKKESEQE